MLAGVHHAALVTRDYDALAAFFAAAFGATAGARSERDLRAGMGFLDLGAGAALHVFERSDGGGVDDERALAPLARGRVDHVALRAADLDAFSTARDRLVELGATDGAVVDFGPLVSLFFVTPDQTQLELTLVKAEGFDPPFPLAPPGRR